MTNQSKVTPVEAQAVPDLPVARNQCDGCARGIPLDNGFHRGPGSWDIQCCTADRYSRPTPAGADLHPIEEGQTVGNEEYTLNLLASLANWLATRAQMPRYIDAGETGLMSIYANSLRAIRERLVAASPAAAADLGNNAFLAARLRRLFAHFKYPLPGFAKDDASLIEIAGSCIGAILTQLESGAAAAADERTVHATTQQHPENKAFWDGVRWAQDGARAAAAAGVRTVTFQIPRKLAWSILGLLSQECAPCAEPECRISSNPEALITQCREELYAVVRPSSPVAPVGAPTEERGAFETWAAHEERLNLSKRQPNGHSIYADARTLAAWDAWQARAALLSAGSQAEGCELATDATKQPQPHTPKASQ